MSILPVVGRELRAIARRPSAYWVRSGAALLAFIAMAYVAMIGAVGLPTGGQGRSLFYLLSLGAFGFCMLAGTRGTSDALSQEKREGTLGLLFLTDLKGYDVVLGKLLSVSVNSLYGVLAIAPPLALAFMLGGTSLMQFVMMLVFFLNTLFFSLAVGIFVSTFSQQERPAMGGTLAIIFVVSIMPYAIAASYSDDVFAIWQVMQPGFLLTSPIFAFTTIQDGTLLRIDFEEVLLSLAFAHLTGWLCLVVASASVAQRAHLDAPRGKFLTWFAALRQRWAYGKTERRRAIRGSLLDRNAFAWLAGRDRLKQRYAWIFLGLVAAIWLFVRWKAPDMREEWPIILFSLWFLHLFFKVWVASEVAARFIEDRRTNALELLLTTPLKLREFARGERLALFRQFGAPLALIVMANLFAASQATESTSFLIRSPAPRLFFFAGLAHLAADLYAIHWIAIWRSMHLRGANRAIVQTILLVVLLPVGMWFVMWQVSWLPLGGAIVGRDSEEILFRWTVLCVAYDLVLAAMARSAFFRDFREAATKSFDKPAPFRWRFRRAASSSQPRAEGLAPRMVRPIFTRARKAAVVFAILLVGLNVIVALRRFRLRNELSARIVQARAGGLPFTPSEVARWRTPVSPAQSASLILHRPSRILASADNPPELFDSVAHWNSREPLAANLKTRMKTWALTNAELYATLEPIRTRKAGGASADERMNNNLRADELARALQIKARLELEDDPAAAAQTIALMLDYTRVLQGESMQGFVVTRKALERANELMERASIQGGFAREHWAAWKNILAEFDSIRLFREMLVSERADGFQMFSLPADVLYQRFGRQFGDFPAVFSMSWAVRRYLGQDKAEMIQYLEHMNQYIGDADQPFWEIQRMRGQFTFQQPSLASSTFIAPQILPAFEWLFTASTETIARQRILMTVCDIEIYRAEHGKLPDDLSELGRLPIDPFNGQPLHYVRRGEEYSLYSVNYDMIDNGGLKATGRTPGDIAFHCGAAPERKRTIKYP